MHLGYEKCNGTAFTDFLANYVTNRISKDYSLFILGDLWDLWRKHDIIFSEESNEILSLVNQFKEAYITFLVIMIISHKKQQKIILTLIVTILANTLELEVERGTSFLYMVMSLR